MSADGAEDFRRRPKLSSAAAANAEILHRLNTTWRVAGRSPAGTSLKGRAGYAVRRLFARFLGPQETFNAAVVQYANATAHQDLLDEVLDHTDAALDEVRRYGEAAAARERRLEAAMAALRSRHDELQTAVGVLQQATQTLARQRAVAAAAPQRGEAPAVAERPFAPTPDAHALSYRYVGFEDLYRGSSESIREGLRDYVDLFAASSDVLDIGCGRGEFLSLLQEAGITARGVDLNESMVGVCRERGLEAEVADALFYLGQQADASFGGLLAAQVVEHLEPGYLTQLLDAAFQKLRPGAPIVLETINPACWFAFFESYIRDITHVRPLHPDTLRFLLVAAGFQDVGIRYRAPYPEHEKLQPVGGALGDSADVLNANVERLNRLLFTHLDYAAIGRRP